MRPAMAENINQNLEKVSRYRFIETPWGFRVEGDNRVPIKVELGPAYFIVTDMEKVGG